MATCFEDGLQKQVLDVVLPHLTEALFFRVVMADNSGFLLCVMYRRPFPGKDPPRWTS